MKKLNFATDLHRRTQTFFPADFAGKKIVTRLSSGNSGNKIMFYREAMTLFVEQVARQKTSVSVCVCLWLIK